MSARQKIRKALLLSWGDRRVLLAAALWLPLADLTLRWRGLQAAQRWLGAGAVADAEPPATMEDLHRLARLVDAAGRHHIKRFTCLPRALVLQRLLARKGIDSLLRIGVKRDGGLLEGHAWVECAGVPIGEGPDLEQQFSVLREGGGKPL